MSCIYWFRSDLRVSDNEALFECLKSNRDVIFIFAQSKSLRKADIFRKKFVHQSFEELKNKIENRGFRILRTEQTFPDFVSTILTSTKIDSLYFTREYAWDEREEEKRVVEFCKANNIEVHSFDQATLIREKDLPFTLQQMPFVFTEFRKKIETHLEVKPLIPNPFESKTNFTPDAIGTFSGGESNGLARLHYYFWETGLVQSYKETRNGLINFDDSTKFSPWLNTGCISPRTIYHELKRYELNVHENDSTYWVFFELLWRDYFKFFSLKYGKKIFLRDGIHSGTSLNDSRHELFKLWCEGKTEDSFVNANMKELNQTGWMSNRGRQNVASYLIHDLGINWTWGAAYFEEKLIDYDPDLNWGNWLYLSGRGSDLRARKFNTLKQAETYDPNGEYRQLWR